MNQYEMAVLIVVVVMVASVIRSIFGVGRRGRNRDQLAVRDDAETNRLRDEVKQLKDRLR